MSHVQRIFTFHDIIREDLDELSSVRPRVLMVEAQCVKDLMDDVTHNARRPNEHRLLAANEAHV